MFCRTRLEKCLRRKIIVDVYKIYVVIKGIKLNVSLLFRVHGRQ